jgi:Arc/MetJ-type ribon-helix-helix transcriptional regulator
MNKKMSISLPPSMKKWVEKQVGKNGYRTANDFFLDVLQREQALQARERIDDALEEALNSGPATPMTRADWDRIRENGRKMLRESRKA